RGGAGNTNCYALTLPADEAAETPQSVAPFNGEKPRPAGHPFDDQKRVNAEVKKGERRGQKPRPAGPPNYSNDSRTKAPTINTGAGAPRLRAVALGAPIDESGNAKPWTAVVSPPPDQRRPGPPPETGLGNGSAPATGPPPPSPPPPPSDPVLAALEA